jgi:uncharacterized protein (TIGR01777 family)
MRVVIAGGTGFLGRPLTQSFEREGHEVTVLTRGNASSGSPPGARLIRWNPDGTTGRWADAIDGADVVVNLAGESIGGKRWTTAQKARIRESRVAATRSLAGAIREAASPPATFVSGSAVGYYGPRGAEPVTEEDRAGGDFLAQVCIAWEEEAMRASSARTRVVCVRTGIVLDRQGGALPRMLPPFRLGAGGPIGSGQQYWPWIHKADWIDMVRFAAATAGVSGPMNATAPNPETNADFARTLGRALNRPAFLPTPGFALRLLLGEMADGLLLAGQRALPAKAVKNGFSFRHPELAGALNAIFAA